MYGDHVASRSSLPFLPKQEKFDFFYCLLALSLSLSSSIDDLLLFFLIAVRLALQTSRK